MERSQWEIWNHLFCRKDFHDRGFLLTKKLQKQRFLLVKLKTPLRSFMVATTAWSTVAKYLCHKWPRYVRPRFLTCLIWVRVSNCCEITCLHVFSSVLLCPLRFPRKIDVQFILAPICYIGDLCFDYVFCIYLPILVSSTMFMSDDVRVI